MTQQFDPEAVRYFNQGVRQSEAKDWQGAVVSFSMALAFQVGYAEAHYKRGLALYELGRVGEAIEDYDQALALNPNWPAYYYSRGCALQLLGKCEEALADYRKAAELNPNNPEYCRSRDVLSKEFETPQKVFNPIVEAILKQDAQDRQTSELTSENYYNRGKNSSGEEAIAHYTKAIELDPNYTAAYNGRGDILYRLGRYEEVIADYSCVIELNPHWLLSILVCAKRGDALYQLERYEEAIADYSLMIVLNPSSTYSYNSRANALHKLGRYEEAITDYNRAIELDPNNTDAYNNRGLIWATLCRYKEMIVDYSYVIKLDPNYTNAYNGRGWALYKLGRYEEALADYNRAIALDPNYIHAYNNRGIALSDLGKFKEAIADYNKTLELDPNFTNAYDSRGIALCKLGRYEEAIADYSNALELDPNFTHAYNNRGSALKDSGRYDKAIKDYDRALALQIDNWQAWANRGLAIKNSLGKKTAILNWDEGLTHLDPATEPLGCGTLHRFKGDTYRSWARQGNEPRYRYAIASYRQARDILQPHPYLRETYLEVLKELIITYRELNDSENAAYWEDVGIEVLERLILDTPHPQHRLRLHRKFSGFYQLKIDTLAQSYPFAAISLAEKRRSLSLQWLHDITTPPLPLDKGESEGDLDWQSLLKPGRAAIYWHYSPVSITTFLLRHQQPLFQLEIPAEPAFSDWISQWKTDYADGRQKKGNVTKTDWYKTLSTRLDELAKILKIPRLREQLQGIQELILVPHRDLHLLPLHAFFPDLTATYLPSLQLGLNLQKLGPVPVPKRLLSVEHPEEDPKKKIRLRYAQVESTTIRKYFPHRTIAGEAATKDAVLAALQEPADIFHFTGHSYHDLETPTESALILADSHLTWLEIANREFPPFSLVCLSACETGMTGNEHLLDDFIGLASAFLAGHSRHVLSTLWQVPELSSALFSFYFYRCYSRNIPPAVALKETQTWLRTSSSAHLKMLYENLAGVLELESPRCYMTLKDAVRDVAKMNPDDYPYDHPYYWAGFILSGQLNS